MALGTCSEASTLLSRTETPSEAVALLWMHPTLMSRSPWVCTFGLFWMTTRAEMKVLGKDKILDTVRHMIRLENKLGRVYYYPCYLRYV
ncbi:hypothetical protein M5D96_000437 [Drosophila gunungcola]|uniref:Uncharacterized protein n=1 Tax=Drosophila gunungcola TaxID=103775 RepID=A0A9Q0BU51_9MUSC|nr:hypothetical protein M5D96_000437 [Drosophila gunungcola]